MSGGRISGWFEVDVPKVVLGYDFVKNPSSAKQLNSSTENLSEHGAAGSG